MLPFQALGGLNLVARKCHRSAGGENIVDGHEAGVGLVADDEGWSGAFDADRERLDSLIPLKRGALFVADRIGDDIDLDAHLHRESPAGDVVGQSNWLGAAVKYSLRIMLYFEQFFG